MKFICSCRSDLEEQKAVALDMVRHDFSVELEAGSQEETLGFFKKQYIENLDLSGGLVRISVKPK